jgi:tetratricopeptide (TPR) repeat protein
MADINLALDGFSILGARLMEAYDFFGSEEAKAIWPPFICKYNQANVLLALNNLPGAIKLYEEVIEEKPDFLLARVNLRNVYRKAKSYDSALKSYEEALKYGKPMELLFNLATLLIQERKQPERALSYLEQIVVSDLHPEKNRESYYCWKAKANLLLERYPEGIAAIKEVLGNSPEQKGTWWDAAKLYAKAYRQDKHYLEPAVNFWNRFLEKLPGIGAAWAELGYVHWNLREIKDKADNCRLGINAYRKSIDLRVGDEALAWAYIGRLYVDLNDEQEAASAFKHAAELKPDEFGYMYGESLGFLRRFEEALPWIETGVRQEKNNPMRWSRLGVSQFNLGDIDKAEGSYLKAIELDSKGEFAEPRFELGGLYWTKGDIYEAIKVWGNAVEAYPDSPYVPRVRDILKGTKFENLITWPSTS